MNKHPTVGDVTFRTAQHFQRSTKAVQHAAPVIPFYVYAQVYTERPTKPQPPRDISNRFSVKPALSGTA